MRPCPRQRNPRRAGCGGPRRQPVRLPLDVLAAVRARVGPDYPVGIRYLGDEVVEGGSRVDDAVWFGIKFAEGGVDYLSVSKRPPFETRSEEHTSELQSQSNLVCRLLLEKKKQQR